MTDATWTHADLLDRLAMFEDELRAADLAENSIRTYVKGADAFLRWLTGDFSPRGPNR